MRLIASVLSLTNVLGRGPEPGVARPRGGRRVLRLVLRFGLGVILTFLLTGPGDARAQATGVAPVIVQQPANGIATTNEDFAFSVVATGTQPLTYQWSLNGSTISGATGPTLLVTNLALNETGNYTVAVANSAGVVASTNAVLVVETNFVHRIGTGRIMEDGGSTAVPITFRSNGREQSVSFSLSFDPNVFSNPRFIGANQNAQTTVDTSVPGTIGVAINVGAGNAFPNGYGWLGLVEFDRAEGRSSFGGSLAFVNTPIAIAGLSVTSQPISVSALVLPQYAVQTAAPALNPQTGLFEQRLLVSNPGAVTMTNIDLFALNLGVDSRTNAISFFNAWGSSTNLPYADPLVPVDCPCACAVPPNPPCSFADYLACGNNNCSVDFFRTNMFFPYAQLTNLLAGESLSVTVEFYVTDHVSVPAPQYSVFPADPIAQLLPVPISFFTINFTRYLTNSFLVEFPTEIGHHYWIQYADSAAALTTGQTVFPPVAGTGSRVQWIDNGPPKTATPPTNSSRVYRVFTEQLR